MSRLLVGLTGGLASGKSTVARLLAERGCTVVDADRLVAELYAPGGAGVAAARRLFGDEVAAVDGSLDREAVARRVFTDAAARRRLEEAIHPLVGERFAMLARDAEGIVVLEATLLAEAGWAERFDVVVTVEAPAAVRRRRAIARGMAPEEADRRLAAQGDGAARRAIADLVLDNSGDATALEREVDHLLAELRRRLAAAAAGKRLAGTSRGDTGARGPGTDSTDEEETR